MRTQPGMEFRQRHGLKDIDRYAYGDELRVGQWSARTVRFGILRSLAFSLISGDWNRLHYCLPPTAKRGPLHGYAVPGLLFASVFSGILASRLPGHGTVYVSQSLDFLAPVRLYRSYVAFVRIREIDSGRHRIALDTVIDRLATDISGKGPLCVGIADVRNYTAGLFR